MSVTSKYMTKEHIEEAESIMGWNDDENGLVNVSPLLNSLYHGAAPKSEDSNDFSRTEDYEKMNKTMRTFINTNLDKLLKQRSQGPNDTSNIDLIRIINGTNPTNWIR